MADELFRRENEGDCVPLTRSCDDSEDDLDLPKIYTPGCKLRCICCNSERARLFLLGLVILSFVLIITIMAVVGKWKTPHAQPLPTDETSLLVQVDCFRVKGAKSEGVFVFKGIPYAEPPVGPLRWKPPSPIQKSLSKCNSSTYDATRFGSKCYQRNMINASIYEGSEDCLFINVWTPSLDSKSNLPVMIWIHGGHFIYLDGAMPTYSPNEQVTKDTNMVFVSMNYRLNAFGFMALDVLSEDSKTNTSGNYGFMDQILALLWVKRNIVNFGGNPNLVTIFGQGSGGTSIVALLASPKTKGLFHRAWLASSSMVFNATLKEASEINLGFLNNTGCLNITCLRTITATQILESIPWDIYPYWAMADITDLPTKDHFDGPLAIVDGAIVPKAPMSVWDSKVPSLDVPVIIGSTAQEVDSSPPTMDIKHWNKSQYQHYVRQKLDTFGGNISQKALELYPFGNGSNAEYLFTSMASDLRVNCPLNKLTNSMSKSSAYPVYRYIICARPSQSVAGYLGRPFSPSFAFHGIDIFSFFGTLRDYVKPLSESDVTFQKTLRKEILNFARNGKTNIAEWTGFPSSTAVIDTNITITDGYNTEKCKFWEANDFFSYAWIN